MIPQPLQRFNFYLKIYHDSLMLLDAAVADPDAHDHVDSEILLYDIQTAYVHINDIIDNNLDDLIPDTIIQAIHEF